MLIPYTFFFSSAQFPHSVATFISSRFLTFAFCSANLILMILSLYPYVHVFKWSRVLFPKFLHFHFAYFCSSICWLDFLLYLNSGYSYTWILNNDKTSLIKINNSLLCPSPETISSPPQFSTVQSLGRVQFFATPRTAARQSSLSITNAWSLLKLMSIEAVMPSNHLFLCRPLLLLPSIFPSIRVFSNESLLHIRCPKYWSFSFSISSFQEYSGLISFRMDWLDLLAVQGTFKSLLQHHSSKASVLQCSAFFMIQLSHPYMTTGKTIALTIWTFVGKVTSLLFNMLSGLLTAFFPRSKRL